VWPPNVGMHKTLLVSIVTLLGLGAVAQQLQPVVAFRQEAMPACMCPNPEAIEANRDGLAAHAERRLKEASEAYSDALRLVPPREPSAPERELIRKFAPIVLTTPHEPFPLKDVAAILHFSQPWIAYHLFWEDDIDFPDDNDPCDHEVIWVRLDASRTRVLSIYTYFHGRILSSSEPVTGRPRVVSQWGKHGTMPLNWRKLFIQADSDDLEHRRLQTDRAIRLEEYNLATWQTLHNQGRESQASPLGRSWPLRFEGSWEQFTTFSHPIDLEPRLRRGGMTMVSYFNNAVINRHFLRYNFAAKTEWPSELCERMTASAP
jgi:hypothetical protein